MIIRDKRSSVLKTVDSSNKTQSQPVNVSVINKTDVNADDSKKDKFNEFLDKLKSFSSGVKSTISEISSVVNPYVFTFLFFTYAILLALFYWYGLFSNINFLLIFLFGSYIVLRKILNFGGPIIDGFVLGVIAFVHVYGLLPFNSYVMVIITFASFFVLGCEDFVKLLAVAFLLFDFFGITVLSPLFVNASTALSKISLIFLYSGKWLFLAGLNFFNAYSLSKKRGEPAGGATVFFLTIILIMLIFFSAPLIEKYRYYWQVSPAQLYKLSDKIKESQATVKAQFNSSKSSFSKITCYLGKIFEDPMTANDCFKTNKSQIQGEVGMSQKLYVHFEPVGFYKDKFIQKEPIIVASNFKIVDSRNSVKRTEFLCNYTKRSGKKSNQSKNIIDINPKELTFASKDFKNNYDTILDPTYYEGDNVCTIKPEPIFLDVGTYEIEQSAVVYNLRSKSSISNLFMNKKALENLLISYAKANKLNYALITRNNLILRVFSTEISSRYPKNAVLSQSEEGNLIKINIETTNDFIFGVDSENQNLNYVTIKASIINDGKGTAIIKSIEIRHPDANSGINPVSGSCELSQKKENLNYKLEPQKTISISPCLNIIDSSIFSDSINTPKEIITEIYVEYDYVFKTKSYFEVVNQTVSTFI